MRVVIDLQGAQSESRFRGVGRYSLSLTSAMLRLGNRHEIFVVLNGMFPETIEPLRAALNGLLPQQNIQVWYAPGPVAGMIEANGERARVAELMREAFIASLCPDIVLVTSLFDGFGDDTVTSIGRLPTNYLTLPIIYDLIPLVNSVVYLESNPVYEKFYQSKLSYLKQADAWLTISESSLNEAVSRLGISKQKIINISGACDPIFRKRNLSESEVNAYYQRLGLKKDFLLYSGGADTRKNLPRLITAYSNLPDSLRQTHQLVIAGKIPNGNIAELKSHAKLSGLSNRDIVFTGSVTDSDLCALYNLCYLYVLPSLHEGFGLPVLEAMSCGAPVIASNSTSLPEVVGIPQALFDPNQTDDIADKLKHVLTNEDFRQTLIELGQKQIALYSWDTCGAKAWLALEDFYTANRASSLNSASAHVDEQTVIKAIAALKPGFNDHALMRCAAMIALNHPKSRLCTLFVDISELARHDAATGVQRVTRSILLQLITEPPEGYLVEPVYADTTSVGYRYARNFMASFLGHDVNERLDEVIETCPGDIFLGLDLQHQITRYQSPYLTALRSRGVGIYFVVYDLLPIHFPQFWPFELSGAHAEWLHVLAKFDGAICISKAVADELKNWLLTNTSPPARPYRIEWFHLGADIDNSKPSKGLPENGDDVLFELAARPTFLSVGTIEPRKRHEQTLAAFDLLWAEGHDVNLVLVGKQGWLMDDLVNQINTHPEKDKRLFWLAGVSDEYLSKIYAASTCLVYSSVGEGFGLPLIEAAQNGLKIIARDLPVFREVAGDCATYFMGDSADALAGSIKIWLAKDVLDQTPDVADMHWITWKQSAEQLKKALFQ